MKRTLPLVTALLGTLAAGAQTVLFQEDFEGSPAFTLNTTDQGSVASSPDNTWVINNGYNGGSGTMSCFGFPFSFTVLPTPAQPAAISSPNGQYMHISSLAAMNAGVMGCSFVAADGLCTAAGNHFARMSTDVSTVGMAEVTLSFWWLCMGSSTHYGELYYSTNGGTSWTLVSGQYRDTPNWTQQTVSLPAFAGQSALRFGFRFVNSVGFQAGDPAFGIDDVRIIGSNAAPAELALGAVPTAPLCAGSTLDVPYTAQGSFLPGNVFTAQLSSATGSFATPVDMGSVTATTSGIINCVIPGGTAAGTGYRIRVVSSTPALTTADNGVDLAITAPLSAGSNGALTVCAGSGTHDLFTQLGGSPVTCGTWTDPAGQPFSGVFNSNGGVPGVYTYSTAACGGSCPAATATVTVTVADSYSPGTDGTLTVCSGSGTHDLFAQLGGSPAACGTWTDPTGQAFSGVFDSDGDVPGVYTYSTAACGGTCPTTTATVTVTIAPGGNAGPDVTQTLCTNALPADLTTLMQGDPGGSFTYQGQSTLPDLTVPGSYVLVYHVGGVGECGDGSAQLTLTVLQAPSAGSSTQVQFCAYHPITDLLTLLPGADPGGTWQRPDGMPFNGMFNPATDADGVYIYTVAGTPPCNDASAALSVVVDPCVGVEEIDPWTALQWLGQDTEGAHIFTLPAQLLRGVEVFDMTGRSVWHSPVAARDGRLRMPLSAPTGMHLVRFHADGGVVRVLRIMHSTP